MQWSPRDSKDRMQLATDFSVLGELLDYWWRRRSKHLFALQSRACPTASRIIPVPKRDSLDVDAFRYRVSARFWALAAYGRCTTNRMRAVPPLSA